MLVKESIIVTVQRLLPKSIQNNSFSSISYTNIDGSINKERFFAVPKTKNR